MNDSQNTKSTRLQFLFGGMFVRRNTAGPLPSVSLASRDSQTMDEAEEDVSDSTPSWWQKLANSLQGQTLACDEDPSQYGFAFSVRSVDWFTSIARIACWNTLSYILENNRTFQGMMVHLV